MPQLDPNKHYPRFAIGSADAKGNEKVMRTPEQHEREFPDDYAAFMEELNRAAGISTGEPIEEIVARAVAEERERCAQIADSFPNPNASKIPGKIAASIRGITSAVQEEPVQTETPKPELVSA